MEALAAGIRLLPGRPRHMINVYLIDGMLVDAGTPGSARRIFRGLGDRVPVSHLVTHAHPDHFGSSAAVCERFGIPLLCGDRDAPAVESGRPENPDTAFGRLLLSRLPALKGHPVDTRLKEGDRAGDFDVLDVPGHSPGHIALWRSGDRTLVLGDVLFNLDVRTMRPGLSEPLKALTFDPAQNRASARRLADLKPELVLFGHGPPLRDPEAFTRFVTGLPE